jgi:hypothetical protein
LLSFAVNILVATKPGVKVITIEPAGCSSLSVEFFKGFSPTFVQALNQQTIQNQADLRKQTHFKLAAIIQTQKLVGLERFELSSIAPEATSLDQASRQPLRHTLVA